MVTPGSLTPHAWRLNNIVVPFFTKCQKKREVLPISLITAFHLLKHHPTCFDLPEKFQWLLYVIGYSSQELRSSRAIYSTVVARKRQYHHGLNGRLTIDRHNPLGYATHSQDSSLWLMNNGVECIDIVHAQVADGESATTYIYRSKFPSLRFCHKFHTLPGNLAQAERICLVNNRNNQSLLDGNC